MAGELKTIYNNNIIHTSTADDTFTLACGGKLMASDVTIQATDVDSLTVTYGGNTIVSGSGTVTKILNCDGRYMSGDIGVAVTIPSVSAASITVTGLGNSNPSTVTFTESGTFNWNFEEVTINNNIFIKIPTMYRKVETVTSNQITSFTLADAQVDSSYQPYPCFLDSNGNVLPYVLIGKYCCSSTSVANSVNASYATQTLATGRTNARALGTGYQLYDWQMQKLFVDLAMCHKKSVNFNSGQTINEYLGIAHLANSIWVDGFYHNSGTWYYAMNPADYISSPNSHPPTGYATAGYACPTTNNREVSKLGYDSNAPFFNQPSAVVSNSSYSTYYCDRYNYSSGSHPVLSNVGNSNNNCGLWYCSVPLDWSYAHGVRLCYRPI